MAFDAMSPLHARRSIRAIPSHRSASRASARACVEPIERITAVLRCMTDLLDLLPERRVIQMAHREKTGKAAASAAARTLRSKKSSKAAKSAAASALTQRHRAKKGK